MNTINFFGKEKTKQRIIAEIKQTIKQIDNFKMNIYDRLTCYNCLDSEYMSCLMVIDLSLYSVKVTDLFDNEDSLPYYIAYEELNIKTLKRVLNHIKEINKEVKNKEVKNKEVKPKRYNGNIFLREDNNDYFSELEILNGDLNVIGISVELSKLYTLNGNIELSDIFNPKLNKTIGAELKIVNLTEIIGNGKIKVDKLSKIWINQKIKRNLIESQGNNNIYPSVIPIIPRLVSEIY